MSTRPPSLGLVADRRIREAASQGAPTLDVRGPLSKTGGRTSASQTPTRPAGAGLTRRERRIKAILLKELEALNSSGKTWISYQERKKLFDTLDIPFIDREIARMKRQLRPRPWLVVLSVSFLAVLVGTKVLTRLGEPLTWLGALDVMLGVALAASLAMTFVQTRKATRRRLWIYEALRELSDAEDEDVQLPESVALADLLIDRIVAQEESARRAPLHRIRS